MKTAKNTVYHRIYRAFSCMLLFSIHLDRGFRFTGNSYLEYKTHRFQNIQRLRLRITFRPGKVSGLLLFSSQYRNGSGDYILVQLQQQQLVFSFDAQSGPTTLRYGVQDQGLDPCYTAWQYTLLLAWCKASIFLHC